MKPSIVMKYETLMETIKSLEKLKMHTFNAFQINPIHRDFLSHLRKCFLQSIFHSKTIAEFDLGVPVFESQKEEELLILFRETPGELSLQLRS